MSLADILSAEVQPEVIGKYTLSKFDGKREVVLVATPEQEAIIDFVLSCNDNLMIDALAGAAKTSTLEFICKYHPVQPILCLAFNKRIADEMSKKLPGHVTCLTLNSQGHRVWMKTCSRKVTLDARKSYTILKQIVDALPRNQRSAAYDVFGETLKAVNKAKIAGYIPEGKYPQATRLISNEEFWTSQDEDDVDMELVDQALTESIRQAYLGNIDFDDQLYMPTLFGGIFPRYPLVMCDEVQDLSEINHAMLTKLVTQRLIAVGDPFQSIYHFRGAKSSGMGSMKEQFKMQEMGLSVSFRCPREVVKNAWFRVPHMKWPEWAAEGQVRSLDHWTADSIEDGAAIICRNNAPLITLAFKLLKRGRGVKLVGFDIGPNLIKTMKKFGSDLMSQDEVFNAIDRWKSEKLLKGKGEAGIHDKAECMCVFAGFGPTLAAAIAYAEDMFRRSGPIQLLSGHKSKGLEWDVVYHLDAWRIPSTYAVSEEEQEQEQNIRYVIETRAKKALYLVDMKTFEKKEEEDG